MKVSCFRSLDLLSVSVPTVSHSGPFHTGRICRQSSGLSHRSAIFFSVKPTIALQLKLMDLDGPRMQQFLFSEPKGQAVNSSMTFKISITSVNQHEYNVFQRH